MKAGFPSCRILSRPSNYKTIMRFRGSFLLVAKIIICSFCLSSGTSQSHTVPVAQPGRTQRPPLPDGPGHRLLDRTWLRAPHSHQGKGGPGGALRLQRATPGPRNFCVASLGSLIVVIMSSLPQSGLQCPQGPAPQGPSQTLPSEGRWCPPQLGSGNRGEWPQSSWGFGATVSCVYLGVMWP